MDVAKKKTVRTISRVEFRRWIQHSRIIILGVILVFVHMQVIIPLKECAMRMGEPLALGEAFIAVGNSGVIVLIIPLLFLVLMADFPQKGNFDYLYQFRASKNAWILGQMLFVLKVALFLVFFLILSSALMMMDSSICSMQFSDAVTHYTMRFPERSGDYVVQLLPENLYHQMSLATAFFHTAILMLLYFLLLALILLLAALNNRKTTGIFVDSILIILGAGTCAARIKAMWLFPMAHTISWVHYEEYLSREIFPMAGSYVYMAGSCAVLAACCLLSSKHYQIGKD